MRKIIYSATCLALCLGSMSIAEKLEASAIPVYHQKLKRAQNLPEEPMVKVLLAKAQDNLLVEIKCPHNIYDPYTGKKLEAAFAPSSYTMEPTKDGLKWGQSFLGIFQIVIIPDEKTNSVMVNGIEYAGAVAFYQTEDKLYAVNWVTLEDFTSSILSCAFLPKDLAAKEALAAYAIALRTKAYQLLFSGRSPYWDAQADECGYMGKAAVRLDAPFVEAMKMTKKLIMTPFTRAGFSKIDKQVIEEICKKMPVSDTVAMTQDGKDAKELIQKYFPDTELGFAQKCPSTDSPILN